MSLICSRRTSTAAVPVSWLPACPPTLTVAPARAMAAKAAGGLSALRSKSSKRWSALKGLAHANAVVKTIPHGIDSETFLGDSIPPEIKCVHWCSALEHCICTCPPLRRPLPPAPEQQCLPCMTCLTTAPSSPKSWRTCRCASAAHPSPGARSLINPPLSPAHSARWPAQRLHTAKPRRPRTPLRHRHVLQLTQVCSCCCKLPSGTAPSCPSCKRT